MPHTSSTRLKSLSLRLSSQSRTSGSNWRPYCTRLCSLTRVTVLATADSTLGSAAQQASAQGRGSVRKEARRKHLYHMQPLPC